MIRFEAVLRDPVEHCVPTGLTESTTHLTTDIMCDLTRHDGLPPAPPSPTLAELYLPHPGSPELDEDETMTLSFMETTFTALVIPAWSESFEKALASIAKYDSKKPVYHTRFISLVQFNRSH